MFKGFETVKTDTSYRDYLIEILKSTLIFQEEISGIDLDLFADPGTLKKQLAELSGDPKEKVRFFKGCSLVFCSVLEMLLNRSDQGILSEADYNLQEKEQQPFTGFYPAADPGEDTNEENRE